MSKTLVLAEKPSVGRDLAAVLGCNQKGNGFLEGSKYIVTWALGHLVTLADPQTYDDKYKTWRLEDLPMVPNNLKTVVMKQTGRQFSIVKTQLTRKDVKDIVIATDAGREGELVARWIIEKARVNKPMKRLWISSITKKAIQDGFKNVKPAKNYDNLFMSAVARSEADWYVGLNATRALTTKFNVQLSSGRVQTPTLGIVQAREDEIRKFVPQKYYELNITTRNGTTFHWHNKSNNRRMASKETAERLTTKLKGKELQITDIRKKENRQFAPQLYDLTELQREANASFGFSGKRTLQIMQNLYERHKILTYPRTDSRVITTDMIPTLQDRLDACGVDGYATIVQKIRVASLKLPKSVVNNAGVTDHHAIIPTEEPVNLGDLEADERRIFDLVVKRFLAVLLPAHIYEEVSMIGKVEEESFIANVRNVQSIGWKEVYEDRRNSVENATTFKKGATISNYTVKIVEGETKPPARLTEGTLLKAMENPQKYMDTDEQDLVKTIQKSGGLGTVATRAEIIDKLFNSQYMELRGKYIFLSQKGKQLLQLAPEGLRSPDLTAEWEEKLQQIEKGTLNKDTFIKEIKEYTHEIVRTIKGIEATFKHDNITGSKCPDCSKLMLEVENKQGKMLRCQDRSCNYKRNIYKNTNARCPDCKKKLKLYGEGDGQMFTCVCGHREKLSTFQKRRKNQSNTRVSKGEMNRYLKNQDDGFANNALAEALKKMK